MIHPRIHERLEGRPWFISPGGYAAVKRVVERAEAEGVQADGLDFSDFVRVRDAMQIGDDGIASIHILGVLGRNLSPLEESCGNTSYEAVAGEIGDAMAAGARGILLEIDSPGGMASGAGELAALVGEVAAEVPVAVAIDDLCASAAYYVASGADAIFAEPSAMVGSIGTIIPWVDASKAFELVGIEFDPIVNEGADLKATMHRPSLEPHEREYLQQTVDDLAAQFHGHVSAYRENLDPEVFRAGCYIGERAQSLGLVDWIGDAGDARNWLRGN